MKKNRKGEGNGLMMIILLAMILFIGFALLNPVANTSNQMTEKSLVYNESNVLPYCFQNVTVQTQVNTTECPTCSSPRSCNFSIRENTTGGWQYAQCPLTNITLRSANSTAITMVADTDYIVNEETGQVALLNTTKWYNITEQGNRTFVDYNYCRVGYIQDAGTRGIQKLILTIMIICLLVVAAGVAYKQFNNA